MKQQLTIVEWFIIIGTAGLLAIAYGVLVEKSVGNTVELLALTGLWLIVSFLVMVGIIGGCRGIERTKIPIPRNTAIIVFTLSTLLFIAAAILNNGLY